MLIQDMNIMTGHIMAFAKSLIHIGIYRQDEDTAEVVPSSWI